MMTNRLFGFVGIIKPRGISSAKVVSKIKQITGVTAGHMGTLDVDADGVLIVALSKATRLFDYFKIKQKTYESTFKFGDETDTLDATGKILKQGGRIPTLIELKKALSKIKKQTMQIPPNFSAVHVEGRRAYSIAREGKEFKLAAKSIKIFELKLLKQINEREFDVKITCSSGTYVRSICRDVAKELSTYGVTTRITRTKCGDFDYDKAIYFEKLNLNEISNKIANVEKIIDLKVLNLNNDDVKKLKNGQTIVMELLNGCYFIKSDEGIEMIAFCENKKLRIKTNLN